MRSGKVDSTVEMNKRGEQYIKQSICVTGCVEGAHRKPPKRGYHNINKINSS